jgi:hypothetical protein
MARARLSNGQQSVDVYGECMDVSALGPNVALTQTHALMLYASADCTKTPPYHVVIPSKDPVSLANLGFVPNSAQVLQY